MDYKDEIDRHNGLRIREFYEEFPDYAIQYFRGIETTTSSRTRLGYAYDLNVFFKFLTTELSQFQGRTPKSITLSELENLHITDLEQYVDFCKYYQDNDERDHANSDTSIKRKISSLRSFYRYFIQSERIKTDPSSLLTIPKLHEKTIIRLDPGEVAELLDHVEQGDRMTGQQLAFHNKTKIRDLAIMTLLLGTGIRVSECVGLNIYDYDVREGCIHIFRKGGKESVVYFGDEVQKAVDDYLNERELITAKPGHEDALFLSLQNKRIGVRAVENLVKKYASQVVHHKKITPHKLRSTYGTNLYRETGDIYLVANVLGHSDVNTTRKHYAAIDEDLKRSARNKVRLREEESPKKPE